MQVKDDLSRDGGQPSTVQQPTPEYPDTEQIRAYGELTFLYLRSDRHKNDPLWYFRRYLQPPIDLKFCKTFRFDGVVRGAITWALLGREAELKMYDADPLEPADWASGPTPWIMEIIAPYGNGLGQRILKEFLANVGPETTAVRNGRYDTQGKLRYVREFRRKDNGRWATKRLTREEIMNTVGD